jgi:T5SS/PEP-CTERM-associated repeat protein
MKNPLRPAARLPHRILVPLFALFAAGAVARAANIYWDAASGTWFTPGGWHNGSVGGAASNAPGAGDTARIASGTVVIGAGVSATTNYLDLGANDTGAAATLVVEGGGYYRANTTLSTGLYDTNNTTLTAGNGIFDIRAGGTVSSGGNWQIAYRANSRSTVNLAGTGTAGVSLSIAASGTSSGTFNILPGGKFLGGTGDLTMSGIGSNSVLDIAAGGTASFKGRGYIGNSGTATINLAGVLTTGSQFYIGNNATGAGAITILAGGTLATGNTLYVGQYGTGTVNVLAGGALVLNGGLVIGSHGAGVLTVDAGGSIVTASTTGRNIYLGDQLGSSGTAIINGCVDTSLGTLTIGQRATGCLYIGQTGTLLSNFANFAATAATPAASGTAIVAEIGRASCRERVWHTV